jgi:hypothetical protein
MRARAASLVLVPLLAVLTACGPVSVDQAEQSCLRDAQHASGPRGNVKMGMTSGNGGTSLRTRGEIELDISTASLNGRDPSDVYNSCVMRRSGQAPTRALIDQPGWRG